MDLGLTDRVALVMGGTAGLGEAVAGALASEGARVAVASRSGGAGETSGERAYEADTRDLGRMRELVAEVEGDLGPVEILVTNTGGPPSGGALEHPAEDWDESYRSLVQAPAALVESALPGMRQRGWGRIVNVGSTTTIEPNPALSLSNTHRAAAVAWFKTLAREIAGSGVTVNTVATGRFATDRLAELHGSMEKAESAAREEIPAGRLGRPEEYGALVAFLCSERAAYLTGAVVPLDGGLLHSI